jgi:hypothetical protein
MLRALIGTAFAGLLLTGCSTPQPSAPAAATTASAAPAGQNCKKLVQDTGSKIIERKTVCDNGPGAGALGDAMRNSNQGISGNK